MLLNSAGIGCVGVNLRLGTTGEAHLITLKRGAAPSGDFTPPNTDAHWER